MRIPLDDKHCLVADKYCCWITCTVKDKNGKEYEKAVSGYYPTFGQAVENYIERKIHSDKITSLTALKNQVRELKKQVREWEAKSE